MKITAFYRRGCNSWLMATWLLCTCGCLHSPRSDPHSILFSSDKGDRIKISDEQAADVQVALGRSLEMRHEPNQAIVAYLEAVRRDPKRDDAYMRLAILHDELGKFAESAEFYLKASRLRPDNFEMQSNWGYSLYLQRRWQDAEAHLRKAIELKPDYARAHNNLGLLLARTERPDEALAEFRRGGSDEAHARANLAFAFSVEGRLDEAGAVYEQALAINPSLEEARKGLEKSSAARMRLAAENTAANERKDATQLIGHQEAAPNSITRPETLRKSTEAWPTD